MTNLQMQQLNIKQIEGLNLSQFNSQWGGLSIGNSDYKIGDILAGINDVQAIKDGDANQKASGMQDLIDKAINLVSKIAGSGEAASATKETKSEDDASKKLDKKLSKSERKMEQTFNEISGKIDDERAIVENANQRILDKEKELYDKQKELEEKVQKITDAQERLNGAKTLGEQQEILAEIGVLSTELQGIIDEFAPIKEELLAAQKDVEASFGNIEAYQGNAEAAQTEAVQETTEAVQDATKQAQQTTKTEATAKVDQKVADAAGQAAQEASSNLLTGTSVAPELYKVQADYTQAANIREQGANRNKQTLSQLIGKIGQNARLIGSFESTITNSLSQFAVGIDTWNNNFSPMIQSIGSFDQITSQKEDFDKAVQADTETVNQALGTSDVIKKDDKASQSEGNKSNDYLNYMQQQEKMEQAPIQELQLKNKKLSFGL